MTIKDVKKNEYFKLLNTKGIVSSKVYAKSHYVREDKKWCIYDVEDVNSFRFVKVTQRVTIDFEY